MNVAALIYPLLLLIGIDLIFLLLAFLLISFLARNKRAAYAVLRRNFLAYFSNPTGYVFLCLFVLLTSMAAFWPNEFFNANLANLDQLNFWFPIIMLFFIPAITMSIWADEKRQGTDELLLTLPADDFDIVVGKYLSVVSIFTASLLFSQISTFLVLVNLSEGEVDTGLFCANYLGYWFVGLAMLSIGMVASFLTSNLTVGFILGALFNAPLAFAAKSDVIFPSGWAARLVASFSLSQQFDNFGRGVISLAPVAFFTLLTLAGLYYCMVLIGRRHWSGGKDGNKMFLHYFVRCIACLVIVFAASFFLRQIDRPRFDVTAGRVSSVSDTTRQILRDLDPERPIVIEAFISNNLPEKYAKTRYDLINLLKEFQSLSGGRKTRIQVQLFSDLESSSEEAQRAKKQYGIEPQIVRTQQRGTYRDEEILMGAAVRSGLSKVVIPFFESGIPVEYELVRSINTVANAKRAKLGVLSTDANFMGGFSMAGGSFRQLEKHPLVEELEKQYDVQAVDASDPIAPGKFDVVLAIQPSSLNPTQMKNFVDAMKSGIPTAIFEDPFPIPSIFPGVPGTGVPKQPQGGMFGGGAPPQPKGDINLLWKALGLKVQTNVGFDGTISPDIVWQQFNPHADLVNLAQATDEWIFVREDREEGIDYLSEENLATAGLREIMFLYAGAVQVDKDSSDLVVTPIVKTRPQSGLIKYDSLMSQLRSQTGVSPAQLKVLQGSELGEQTIAAYIEGKSAAKEGDSGSAAKLRVFYVCDIDCLAAFFVESRKNPDSLQINLPVQNVTFFLNIVDVLAGETNYPKVRNHEPQHVSLRLFERQAQQFQRDENENQKKFQEEFNNEMQKAEEENQRAIAKFQERIQKLKEEGATDASSRGELIRLLQELQIKQQSLERKLAIQREKLEGTRDEKIKASRLAADLKTRSEQSKYKYLAIFLPPIPPLLVGIGVFVSRRVREREGISKSRLR